MKNERDVSKNSLGKTVDRLAEETKSQTSNGNRESTDSIKSGGAERGGPGQSHAKAEQPPDAASYEGANDPVGRDMRRSREKALENREIS